MVCWQVAGWGFDSRNLKVAVLTEVELPVVSNAKCRRDTIRITGDNSVTRTLTGNMFCAGYGLDTPPAGIALESVCFLILPSSIHLHLDR